MIKILYAHILILALVLSSCAKQASTGTPATPTPPQIQIANDINALAQGLDAAITALRTARDQGKISASDVLTAEKVAAVIAATGKRINAELRSADDWPTQKKAIVGIITGAGIQAALQSVPANARAYLATAIAVYNQIAVSVGGPTV